MSKQESRREFLKKLALGSGAAVLFGSFGLIMHSSPDKKHFKVIIVDFDKCAGCRTCETVCSAVHHKSIIDGALMDGLGNPKLSNIKVYSFNPDADVPIVCALCPDHPCITACPVPADLFTGRKALYKHPETGAVTNDLDRCIGCGQCAIACESYRTGTIKPNAETNKPERICDLCGGDPACVKECPFGALAYKEMEIESPYFGKSENEIGAMLIEKFYGIENTEASITQ